MSEQLRLQILDVLSGTKIKKDVELAQELGQSKRKIQTQLDILEEQEYVNLTKTLGPSYRANITSRGELYLEQVREHMAKQPTIVFISHNPRDKQEKDKLLDHLGVLEHDHLIKLWSYDNIGAGANRKEEISNAIAEAKVAILLISANLLNDEFILNKEIPEIRERRAQGELTIIPVIARACAWESIEWLEEMQVRPADRTPIWGESNREDVDRELAAIANEVVEIVLDKTSSQPPPEDISLVGQDNVSVQEQVTVEIESEETAETETIDFDVPLFTFFREIEPTRGIHTKGIQFTDKDPEGSDPPKLYLSVYFKESKYFIPYPLSTNEKWLYLEANMRPALNLRIQVRAWNMRDVDEFMNFLHNRRDEWDMHGPRPANDQTGDYFYMWREKGENRMLISTFTPTNAGISIHARFSNHIAKAFADYLEEVGFTKESAVEPLKYQVGEVVRFGSKEGRIVEARLNDKGEGVVRRELNDRRKPGQWVSNLGTGGKGEPGDGGEMYLLEEI